TTPDVRLLLNVSYKKCENSWSAPQIYMDVKRPNAFKLNDIDIDLEEHLNTIAVFDTSASPEALFIAMYAGEKLESGDTGGTTSKYLVLHTAFIDKTLQRKRHSPI
ncbi:hypothetical protein, partial [Pseudomonas viridiflava]|uniref:hypothetical protein n=1 Tax=Pseudomonas viridiflava TaxID=33069 RepID=UPI0013CEEB64